MAARNQTQETERAGLQRPRVLKFGGAALQDGVAIGQAVEIVREHGGQAPLVVVSAHAGVTRHLARALRPGEDVRAHWDAIRIRHRTLLHQLGLPQELLDRHLRELLGVLQSLSSDPRSRRRLRDHVLSFGERMSARVFAAALSLKGLAALPLDAFDIGMVSQSGKLCSPESASSKLRALIDKLPAIPVITGFLALDDEGYVTTLGSSGSDLTAAWVGAALGAESIDLWKRVSGLMRADPLLVAEAEHLPRLDWSESEELALHGAAALHAQAVAPARVAGVPIHLRSMDDPAGPGTLVSEARSTPDASGPLALAHRMDLVHLRLPLGVDGQARVSLEDALGQLVALGFDPYLAQLGEGELQVLVSAGPEFERLQAELPEGAEVQPGLGTIAIIGHGLGADARLAGVLEACARIGALEIHAWTTGGARAVGSLLERRVLLLPEEELPAMLTRLYAELFEPSGAKSVPSRDLG